MDSFVVFGVAGALAVKRIVDFLKKIGVPKERALLVAFLTALVLLAANEAAAMLPAFMVWYGRIWNVLFYALVASEVYDLQRSVANNR